MRQVLVVFVFFLGIFFCMLLVLTAVMTWLVLYPGPFIRNLIKLYDIPDMDFKMLLVALAALNFLMCFVVEVSEDIKKLEHDRIVYDSWS